MVNTANFQASVNIQQAVGVEGDFASANPRSNLVTNEAGFVAGANGVIVGQFAWIAADGRTVNSSGTAPNAPDGYVHREQQALFTTYGDGFGMIIPAGFTVVLHRGGDFYDKVSGSTAATRGATTYANYSNGALTIGSAATGASATGIIGSTNTAALGSTFTATGAGTSLTTSAVTGLISIGETISGTGVPVGTTIVSQTSGTAGGAGVYVTSVATTASAATVTSFGKVVVVSVNTAGIISIGDTIAGGAGFPTGATIVSQVSGTTGVAGTYTISAPGTAYTASAASVTTYGTVLNITGSVTGTILVGEAISGTGIPAANVLSQVSGAIGGIGVYTTSLTASAYAASTTVTFAGGIASGWSISVAAAVGELAVITK